MLPLVCFENTFIETANDGIGYDAIGCITIDGYPENEHEPGQVVARVYITKHHDIVVDWHDNAYRINETCMGLINASINQLKQDYYSDTTTT